jgi:hypothetical protein
MNLKKRLLYLLLAVLSLQLSACSGTDAARWTEEVRSSDGTIFQLEGRGEIGANGWPLQHRGSVRYVEYYHRQSGAYWRSGGGYRPVIAELAGGSLYMVVLVASPVGCYLTGFPEKGVLVHRWNPKNGWEHVDVSKMPSGMEFNMLQQIFDGRSKHGDIQGYITLAEKFGHEGNRTGELARWVERNGNYCSAEKAVGATVQTDAKPPQLTGFHGKPDF